MLVNLFNFTNFLLGQIGNSQIVKIDPVRLTEFGALQNKQVRLVSAGEITSAIVTSDNKVYFLGLNRHGKIYFLLTNFKKDNLAIIAP